MRKVGIIGLTEFSEQGLRRLLEFKENEYYSYVIEPSEKPVLPLTNNIKKVKNLDELTKLCELVLIALSNNLQFDIIRFIIKKGKDIFIINPYILNADEIKTLITIREEAGVKVFTNLPERFHPVFIKSKELLKNKTFFVHSERTIRVNPKGNKNNVKSFLIDDIDLVINIIHAQVKKIFVNSTNVFGNMYDLINLRIDFDNSAVANIIINSVSDKNYRMIKVFNRNIYMEMDYVAKELNWIKKSPLEKNKVLFAEDTYGTGEEFFTDQLRNIRMYDVFKEQLEHFFNSVLISGHQHLVTLNDIYHATRIYEQVEEKLLKLH